MILNDGSNTNYPKFKNIGDEVEGDFVAFDRDVPGKFGIENILRLVDEGSELHVRCPATLTRTLASNLRHLVPHARVKIKFTKTIPTNKGNPAKCFEVDVQPPNGDSHREESKTDQNDPLPF